MRCAARGCKGRCTTKNALGVGDVCVRPAPFDPLQSPRHGQTVFDDQAEQLLMAQETERMREQE